MRIIYMGSGEFGCPTLQALADSCHDLVEVVTQPARPAGRGKQPKPTPIAQLAQTLDLPVRECDDVNAGAFVSRLRELAPQVIMVIAFGQKIGPDIINLPGCRTINLHGSLLPAYRGAAPINWVIINGEARTGVTVIEINNDWDAGAILGQADLAINPDDTAGELHDRLAQLGPELSLQVIEDIAHHRDQPLVQNNAQASRAPKLRKADGKIDWSRSAVTVRNHVHGMWPWPGAFATILYDAGRKRERVTLARVQVAGDNAVGAGSATAGSGVLADDFTVVCAPGRLHIRQLRPESGRLMNFTDYINGRRLRPGDRFIAE